MRSSLWVVLAPWLVVACSPRSSPVVEESPGDLLTVQDVGELPERLPWKPRFQGVDLLAIASREPRPLSIHAVRVELGQEGVGFLVTPPNGEKEGETDGRKTSSFLVEQGCQVAVNASPFRPITATEGDPRDVIGLSISNGVQYSVPEGEYGVLLLGPGRGARIAVPPLELDGVEQAVGGFRPLLKGGANVGSSGPRHPRTAVGVTRDGRHLILLTIDGRQPGISEGTTTAETAEWIRRLGAHDALNLDGGGSTTLVMADGSGGFEILNRPIHGGAPGAERVNGNHLGVLARPLGD